MPEQDEDSNSVSFGGSRFKVSISIGLRVLGI